MLPEQIAPTAASSAADGHAANDEGERTKESSAAKDTKRSKGRQGWCERRGLRDNDQQAEILETNVPTPIAGEA